LLSEIVYLTNTEGVVRPADIKCCYRMVCMVIKYGFLIRRTLITSVLKQSAQKMELLNK